MAHVIQLLANTPQRQKGYLNYWVSIVQLFAGAASMLAMLADVTLLFAVRPMHCLSGSDTNLLMSLHIPNLPV